MHNLTEAAVVELINVGYPALTVRMVAKRAGVAPATAYTYFGSKEHLVAEVFWRRFEGQNPRPLDLLRSPAARATDVLLDFALVVADETEVAAAVTVAMLSDDAEVRELRTRIGMLLHRRLIAALGDDTDPIGIATLELAISGVLLQVGTGHLAYDVIPGLLADVATLVLEGTRS